jgi:pimeloyl-ACP methyl ester carboxylesterase
MTGSPCCLPTARRRVGATLRALMVLVAFAAVFALVGCGDGGATSGTVQGEGGGSVPGGGRIVAFSTGDGVEISGTLFGGSDRGIVLLHMYPADQTSWYPEAERLLEQGYMVLTVDFRGYGRSGGDKDIGVIDRDVEAAVGYMEERGAAQVALVGASMGGTAALMAADGVPVAGVATLSAPVGFKGLDAIDAVTRVDAPVLFLGTLDDSGGEAARTLYELAAEPRRVEVFPGGDHGTDMLSGSQADAVQTVLEGWLADVLGPTVGGGT